MFFLLLADHFVWSQWYQSHSFSVLSLMDTFLGDKNQEQVEMHIEGWDYAYK